MSAPTPDTASEITVHSLDDGAEDTVVIVSELDSEGVLAGATLSDHPRTDQHVALTLLAAGSIRDGAELDAVFRELSGIHTEDSDHTLRSVLIHVAQRTMGVESSTAARATEAERVLASWSPRPEVSPEALGLALSAGSGQPFEFALLGEREMRTAAIVLAGDWMSQSGLSPIELIDALVPELSPEDAGSDLTL